MILLRLLVTAVTGFTVAVVFAVAIGIADIFLSGHGEGRLMQERITIPALGVHLSLGDLIMLAAAFLVSALAWRLSKPSST